VPASKNGQKWQNSPKVTTFYVLKPTKLKLGPKK
jgi:hypothetical protein